MNGGGESLQKSSRRVLGGSLLIAALWRLAMYLHA